MSVRAGTPSANVECALGGEPAAFAAEFAATHAPEQDVFVVPVSNGTRAITLALMALSVCSPDERFRQPELGYNVIVPGLTWTGTATAALGRYAPRLADVRPDTLCIDADAAESLIDDRTAAIIVVHLYNRMADLERICAIAAKHGIPVIEDCAHAHGARYGPSAAGTVGAVGTFSLQGSKVLTTGEGGFVITSSSQLADQVTSLATAGRRVGGSVELQGGNDRMSSVAAAFGRAQLTRWPEQSGRRQETFRALDAVAAMVDGVMPLAPQPAVEVSPAYKWAARYDLGEFAGMSLDQLGRALEAQLGCEVTRTYAPLNDSPLYIPHSDPFLHISDDYWAEINPRQYALPAAEAAHASVLCIEHAAGLDEKFADHYAKAIERIRADAERIARETAP
jgi:dTDP-4-amino-4,6-dideoxygalactose transaminase